MAAHKAIIALGVVNWSAELYSEHLGKAAAMGISGKLRAGYAEMSTDPQHDDGEWLAAASREVERESALAVLSARHAGEWRALRDRQGEENQSSLHWSEEGRVARVLALADRHDAERRGLFGKCYEENEGIAQLYGGFAGPPAALPEIRLTARVGRLPAATHTFALRGASEAWAALARACASGGAAELTGCSGDSTTLISARGGEVEIIVNFGTDINPDMDDDYDGEMVMRLPGSVCAPAFGRAAELISDWVAGKRPGQP